VTSLESPKEYLRHLRRLEVCIEQRQEELNRLRELIGCHAIDYGDRVQTSPSADSIPNEVIRRAELEADISRKIERFLQLKHKIINEIQSLDNAVYVKILYMRYVEYKSLDEIAEKMNYSYRQVLRLHGTALKEFRKNLV
jgi:DNA-directed RNA polymerase specialized sigma subunit